MRGLILFRSEGIIPLRSKVTLVPNSSADTDDGVDLVALACYQHMFAVYLSGVLVPTIGCGVLIDEFWHFRLER